MTKRHVQQAERRLVRNAVRLVSAKNSREAREIADLILEDAYCLHITQAMDRLTRSRPLGGKTVRRVAA